MKLDKLVNLFEKIAIRIDQHDREIPSVAEADPTVDELHELKLKNERINHLKDSIFAAAKVQFNGKLSIHNTNLGAMISFSKEHPEKLNTDERTVAYSFLSHVLEASKKLSESETILEVKKNLLIINKLVGDDLIESGGSIHKYINDLVLALVGSAGKNDKVYKDNVGKIERALSRTVSICLAITKELAEYEDLTKQELKPKFVTLDISDPDRIAPVRTQLPLNKMQELDIKYYKALGLKTREELAEIGVYEDPAMLLSSAVAHNGIVRNLLTKFHNAQNRDKFLNTPDFLLLREELSKEINLQIRAILRNKGK